MSTRSSTTAAATTKRKRTPSDAQATQAATIAMLGSVWKSLDDGTKAGWVSMAQQTDAANNATIGVQPKTSAYLTFIATNVAIYATTGTVLSTAPASPVVPPPIPLALLTATFRAGVLNLSLITQPYASHVLVYGAPPVPAGQNVYKKKGAFKLLGTLPSLAQTNDISRLYNAKFRGAGAGSKIALKLVGVSATGTRSAQLFVSGVTPFTAAADTDTDTGKDTLKMA